MKPKAYHLRIEKTDMEDSINILIEAVAYVHFETEALGVCQQEFRSKGEPVQYDLDDETEDDIVTAEIEQLKLILEIFGVDLSEWDELIKDAEKF